MANYIIYVAIFLTSLLLFYTHMYFTKDNPNSAYNLYYKVNEVSLNIEKLGILNSYKIDLLREIFGFEQEIENEASLDDTEIEEIRE